MAGWLAGTARTDGGGRTGTHTRPSPLGVAATHGPPHPRPPPTHARLPVRPPTCAHCTALLDARCAAPAPAPRTKHTGATTTPTLESRGSWCRRHLACSTTIITAALHRTAHTHTHTHPPHRHESNQSSRWAGRTPSRTLAKERVSSIPVGVSPALPPAAWVACAALLGSQRQRPQSKSEA